MGTTGLQFNPKSLADVFDVSIKINAELGTLLTFALQLFYNHQDLQVVSCKQSGGWADRMFEASVDDKEGEILLAGNSDV